VAPFMTIAPSLRHLRPWAPSGGDETPSRECHGYVAVGTDESNSLQV